MCSNLLQWSLFTLLITFIVFCPVFSNGEKSGSSSRTTTTSDDEVFISSEEKCPCIPRNQCPRIYGERANDVKELGFLRPCHKFGTVRCCGVTVSIRIEHDKEDDFEKVEKPKPDRFDGINHKNFSSSLTFVGGSFDIFNESANGGDINGGLSSNYLWDREDDLEVAESNQNEAIAVLPAGTEPEKQQGKKTLRTGAKIRQRKKLSSMSELRAKASSGSNNNNVNKETMENSNSESVVSTGTPTFRTFKKIKLRTDTTGPSSTVKLPAEEEEEETTNFTPSTTPAQQISNISKLRVVRPGHKMRPAIQTQTERTSIEGEENHSPVDRTIISTSNEKLSPPPTTTTLNPSSLPIITSSIPEGTSFGLKPRKRILRRKKLQRINAQSTGGSSSLLTTLDSSSSLLSPSNVKGVESHENDKVEQAAVISSSESTNPVVSNHELVNNNAGAHTTNPINAANIQTGYKFSSNKYPTLLMKRKPGIPFNSNRNEPTSDNTQPRLRTYHSEHQFSRLGENTTATIAIRSEINAAEEGSRARNNVGENEGKVEEELPPPTLPVRITSSVSSATKPLRRRLRPIRPATTGEQGEKSLGLMNQQKKQLIIDDVVAGGGGGKNTGSLTTSGTSSSSTSSEPSKFLNEPHKQSKLPALIPITTTTAGSEINSGSPSPSPSSSSSSSSATLLTPTRKLQKLRKRLRPITRITTEIPSLVAPPRAPALATSYTSVTTSNAATKKDNADDDHNSNNDDDDGDADDDDSYKVIASTPKYKTSSTVSFMESRKKIFAASTPRIPPFKAEKTKLHSFTRHNDDDNEDIKSHYSAPSSYTSTPTTSKYVPEEPTAAYIPTTTETINEMANVAHVLSPVSQVHTKYVPDDDDESSQDEYEEAKPKKTIVTIRPFQKNYVNVRPKTQERVKEVEEPIKVSSTYSRIRQKTSQNNRVNNEYEEEAYETTPKPSVNTYAPRRVESTTTSYSSSSGDGNNENTPGRRFSIPVSFQSFSSFGNGGTGAETPKESTQYYHHVQPINRKPEEENYDLILDKDIRENLKTVSDNSEEGDEEEDLTTTRSPVLPQPPRRQSYQRQRTSTPAPQKIYPEQELAYEEETRTLEVKQPPSRVLKKPISTPPITTDDFYTPHTPSVKIRMRNPSSSATSSKRFSAQLNGHDTDAESTEPAPTPSSTQRPSLRHRIPNSTDAGEKVGQQQKGESSRFTASELNQQQYHHRSKSPPPPTYEKPDVGSSYSSNYESAPRTTTFPPYKHRSSATTFATTTPFPMTTVSSINSATFPSSSSSSFSASTKNGYSTTTNNKRRVVKPSLLLQSSSPSMSEVEEQEKSKQEASLNTNYQPIIESSYHHVQQKHENYYSSATSPNSAPTTTTTPRSSMPTTHAFPAYKVKTVPHNYYQPSSTSAPITQHYVHSTAPAPTNDDEVLEPDSPKFVFPPYRFEITSKPVLKESNEEESVPKKQNYDSQKYVGPTFVYSATVPSTPTTPAPRAMNYLPTTESNAYAHQISPTEPPFTHHYYQPSTTPMPFVFFSTTSSPPVLEDDGQYHRHHHLHYVPHNNELTYSTPAPVATTLASVIDINNNHGRFSTLKHSSSNASSTRFQAPEVFNLATPSYSYSTPTTTPLPPVLQPYQSPGLSFNSWTNENEEAFVPPHKEYYGASGGGGAINGNRFPGHVEIDGMKRPAYVHVKVAGLNGQQQMMSGLPQQLQTVIDIQNPVENHSPPSNEYKYVHTSPPVSGPMLTSINPEGLPALAVYQQHYSQGIGGEIGETSSGEKFPSHHQFQLQQPHNFSPTIQIGNPAVSQEHKLLHQNHLQQLMQQSHMNSLLNNQNVQVSPSQQPQNYYKSHEQPSPMYEHSPQVHQLFNQAQDVNLGKSPIQTVINISHTATPSQSSEEARLNSYIQTSMQLQQKAQEIPKSPTPQLPSPQWNTGFARIPSHQSSSPTPASPYHSLPNQHIIEEGVGQQMLKYLYSPAQDHLKATTPATIWKFPSEQNQNNGAIHHQSLQPQPPLGHLSTYQNENRMPFPQTTQQFPFAKPGTGSTIEFGTAVRGKEVGNIEQFRNSQIPPRTQPVLGGGGLSKTQQQKSNNLPHYIDEYHQHHAISQRILSQLQNSNKFRMSRAANLDDLELLAELQEEEYNRTITPSNDENGMLKHVPETESNEPDKNESKLSTPELVSFFTFPDIEERKSMVHEEKDLDNEKNIEKEPSSDDGSFNAPKTIERGFLPIVPYSEQDPGPLLVNVPSTASTDSGNSISRMSKALLLEKVPEPVVVSLTTADDHGGPQQREPASPPKSIMESLSPLPSTQAAAAAASSLSS